MRNGVYRWEEKEIKSRKKSKTKKLNEVGLRWKVTKKRKKIADKLQLVQEKKE